MLLAGPCYIGAGLMWGFLTRPEADDLGPQAGQLRCSDRGVRGSCDEAETPGQALEHRHEVLCRRRVLPLGLAEGDDIDAVEDDDKRARHTVRGEDLERCGGEGASWGQAKGLHTLCASSW